MSEKKDENTQVENMMDATPETPQEQPESDKIAELQQQLEESRNKYLYLFSDFENFKRNAARERMELMTTAGRDILTAMLPIVDDFDRAMKNGALSEGTSLIQQKFMNILKTKGLNMMSTQVGDEFNADLHEAIAEIPAPSADMSGKIIDIVELGCKLGDRIIRHSKVVVGR